MPQGQAPVAAAALERALRIRTLKPGDGPTATDGVSRTLSGLVDALVRQRPKEGEDKLRGALAAVDQINRLVWRYFVQQSAFEGQAVMEEVRCPLRVGGVKK